MMIFYQNLSKKVEKVMKINNIKIYVNYSYYKNGNIRKLEYLMVNVFYFLLIKFHQSTQKINKFVDFLENELENNWIPYEL